MRFVDIGSGPPVVVIPGVQGRWEWMKPGIDALAQRCRVVTYSLADEPSWGGTFDERAGFACYVDQVGAVMDLAGLERATICGVSYGGLIASAFAARHPERVQALVLVSALPPSWKPDARALFYLRAPRLLSPLFIIGSLRAYREIVTAHTGAWPGLRAAARHGLNVLTHMFSPARMARRIRLLAGAELSGVSRTRVPTLVITGDAYLDRIVPVKSTREYLRILPHAHAATIDRTGHLGFITRPEAVASLVAPFAAHAGAAESRRRVG